MDKWGSERGRNLRSPADALSCSRAEKLDAWEDTAATVSEAAAAAVSRSDVASHRGKGPLVPTLECPTKVGLAEIEIQFAEETDDDVAQNDEEEFEDRRWLRRLKVSAAAPANAAEKPLAAAITTVNGFAASNPKTPPQLRKWRPPVGGPESGERRAAASAVKFSFSRREFSCHLSSAPARRGGSKRLEAQR